MTDDYNTFLQEGDTVIMFEPYCIDCRWFINDHRCVAFPNGIPLGVWRGEISHKENVEGDSGYKFEYATNENNSWQFERPGF